MMNSKRLKKTLLPALILSLSVILSSCGSFGKNDLDALIPTIEKSREVLSAVYGEGLETEPEQPRLRSYWEPVKEGEKFITKNDLTEAMREVFTEAYTGVLCITAFEGVSVSEGILRARYIENDGRLYADSEYETQVSLRTPDYDSMKLVRSNRYMAQIQIEMICSDGTREPETFIVRKEDGVWKLDGAVL